MTDRVRSLTVVLDRDTRTDDVQIVVNAISMIKGVHLVTLGVPVKYDDFMARAAVAAEMRGSLIDTISKFFQEF